MPIHIAKVEDVVGQLDQIDNTQGNIMASVAWSFAVSLGNALVARARLDDSTDFEFSRLSPQQRADRGKRLEARIEELRDIVAWASAYAATEFAPTGEAVMTLLSTGEAPTAMKDENHLQDLATLMGVTLDEAKRAEKQSISERRERQVRQKHMATTNSALFAKEIDRSISAPVDDFEISHADGMRIIEKIANKADQYGERRLNQAMNTRRKRRIESLAAERRVLEDIANSCDNLLTVLESEEAAQGPAMQDPEEMRHTSV